jgi:hypothetical protein
MREEIMTKSFIQRKIQGPIPQYLQYLFVTASFFWSAIEANDWQNFRPYLRDIPVVRDTSKVIEQLVGVKYG